MSNKFFRPFAAALFLFLSIHSLAQRNWESRKKQDGIEVFVKKQDNATIKTYKAITSTNASVSECVSFLLDLENHVNWSYTVATSEIIEKDGEDLLCYMLMDAPWPADDRDIVIRASKKKLSENKVQVSLKAIEGVKDEKEGVVRIKESLTTWTFIKNGDHTDIIYQGVTDPGGKVPDWMINAGLVDGPFETLKNFVELVES